MSLAQEMNAFANWSRGGRDSQDQMALAEYRGKIDEYLKQKELEKQMALAQYQSQLQRGNSDYTSQLAMQQEMHKAAIKQQQEEQLRQQMLGAQQAGAQAMGTPAVPWKQDVEEAGFAPMDTSGMLAKEGTNMFSNDPQQQLIALQQMLGSGAVFPGASDNAAIATLMSTIEQRNKMLMPAAGDVPKDIQSFREYERMTPEQRALYERQQKIVRDVDNARLVKQGEMIGSAVGSTLGERIAIAPKAINAMESSLDDLERILPLVDYLHENADRSTTGIASLLAYLPETEAKTWRERSNTLKANQIIEKINQMKQQSATGATGLGQITEKEIDILDKSWASLQQSQDPKAIRENLSELKRILSKYYEALQLSRAGEIEFYNRHAPEYVPPGTMSTFNDREPYSPVRSFTRNIEEITPRVAPQQKVDDWGNW